MSDKPNKNTNNDIPILSEVGTLSRDTTWTQMSNYKPRSAQSFYDDRQRNGVWVKGGHQGTDFSEPGTSIRLGTEITSMTNGEARRYPYTYHRDKNGNLLPVDYAVVVTGTAPNGQKYRVTYGHLTEESTREYPTGTRDIDSATVPVGVGTALGKVSDNSLARDRNGRPQSVAHHLHMKVEVWGRNPKTGKIGFYSVDPVEFIQAQTPVYQKQSNAEVDAHVHSDRGISATTATAQQEVSPLNPGCVLASATSTPTTIADAIILDKAPTAELRKLVALAMKNVRSAETISDKTLKPVASVMLRYGVSQEIVTQALTDHHTHVSGQGLSAEEASLEAEKVVAAAASDLNTESATAQVSLKPQRELV
jgi:hypothetical protein